MKAILFDTNIILDVLLDRQPFADASAAAWNLAETGICKGLVAAHAITTIHYLLRREQTAGQADRVTAALLNVFAVAAVNGEVIRQALQPGFADFEDAVTASSAFLANCDCIVTRDTSGFRHSPVRAFTPEGLISVLNGN
jgi:predicted nucleic acid-binding protein